MDKVQVLDCRVDELQAKLNGLVDDWLGQVWNFYDRGEERRVTVVMGRMMSQPVALPPGFNPRGNRRN